MSRMVVVTSTELAPGFQLAGVRTRAATDSADAIRILRELLADAENGVIGVHEPFLTEALRELPGLESMVVPVVVSLPSGEPGGDAEQRRARLMDLIRRAVGYRVTFGPEEL